jgi:probable F420-dependent oxidoreductase
LLTRTGLKLGLAIPQVFPDGIVDTETIREFVTGAEAAGFDDLWLQERIIGKETSLEPLSLMSYVAALTQRVRLGVSVLILPHRNPIQLAKELATLDQLSGGRINAGVGLGNSGPYLYPAFGLSEDHRVSRFTESVAVMKALWTLPEVNLEGQFFHLTNTSIVPKPLQQPHIPLWYGAQSKPAMRRAAQDGDAWMGAGAAALKDTVAHIQEMKRELQEAGRRESEFVLSKRVYMVVDEDERRGHERLENWFGYYYHSRERAAVSGLAASPAHCIDLFNTFREAGLDHMLLNTLDEHPGQLQLLTEKVAPFL